MERSQRNALLAAPWVLIALGVTGYGLFRLSLDPPAAWTPLLAMIASVVLAGPFKIRLGHSAAAPRIGVTVAILAVAHSNESPAVTVCVWTIGVAISQILMRRDLLQAAAATGLNAAAATAFVAISISLTSIGMWGFPSFLVATLAYYACNITGELLRRKAVSSPETGWAIHSLSSKRVLLLILVVTSTATAIAFADVWLERGTGMDRSPFLVLFTGLVFFVLSQQGRYTTIERQLGAVVTAAVELPQETGSGFAQALIERARTILHTEIVELRAASPEHGEIGSPIELEPGVQQYLVASRKIGGETFTRDDEHALDMLTQMANAAARTRDEVESLERRANSDPLTGLPNYGAFQKALLDANEHRPYHEGIALLFIDLDSFKKLNDTYGHRTGDQLLQAVAQRLQEAAGGGGFVSRVGGDEFVVILSDLDSLEQAKEAADRIIAEVSKPLELENCDLRPVVSAGLAFSSHRELDAQSLVEDADRTMLQVKRSRHEGTSTQDSGISVSTHRSSRTNDIVERAINDNRLMLAFQPVVNIAENRIWAHEALVRYVDPELGPISPPSLVARAKSLGLMNELTMQVITKALDTAEQFRRIEPSVSYITVNLELGQISDAELGPFIREAAKAHPDISLCIELNERSLRAATAELKCDAEALQRDGLTIALDDYGSDDSSVGALVHFPMNVLKIDKSLIGNLLDPRQRELIKALQGFGDTLGHTVVVEGVETQEMVDLMVNLGVQHAQGYHYGRPLVTPLALDRLKRTGTLAAI